MTNRKIHNAYKAALDADVAYSTIIASLCGPKATRWSISGLQANDTRIREALQAKLEADARLLDVMRE
jgi:hypothetical protein